MYESVHFFLTLYRHHCLGEMDLSEILHQPSPQFLIWQTFRGVGLTWSDLWKMENRLVWMETRSDGGSDEATGSGALSEIGSTGSVRSYCHGLIFGCHGSVV